MDNPRAEKVAVVTEVRERFQRSSAAILTEYRGLSVKDLAGLRRTLRDAGSEYKIYKNTLVRFAAADLGLDGLEALLVGPTAIAFVEGDASNAAKALREYARTNPKLTVKGGVLGTSIMTVADTSALADLPPREVVLSQLAGALAAPLQTFAGLLQALPRSFAYGLKALIDKRGGVDESAAPEVLAEQADAPTEVPAAAAEPPEGAADEPEPAAGAADEPEPPARSVAEPEPPAGAAAEPEPPAASVAASEPPEPPVAESESSAPSPEAEAAAEVASVSNEVAAEEAAEEVEAAIEETVDDDLDDLAAAESSTGDVDDVAGTALSEQGEESAVLDEAADEDSADDPAAEAEDTDEDDDASAPPYDETEDPAAAEQPNVPAEVAAMHLTSDSTDDDPALEAEVVEPAEESNADAEIEAPDEN